MSSNNSKDLPIGVFDSGFGGLSAVREIQRILPFEDITYFGDTARVPYGTKSVETLKKYASQDVAFLIEKGVKAIVIACGTVSSVAYDMIEELSPVPVVGIVKPAAKYATEITENGVIGIWGTNTTVKSHSIAKEIERIGRDTDRLYTTCETACPLLVTLVENGYISDGCEITLLAIREYLSGIILSNADTLILGCTHFPLISSLIESEWSRYRGGKIVNSGRQAAEELKNRLTSLGLLSDNTSPGRLSVYSSDDMTIFSQQARIFLDFDGKANFKNIEFISKKTDIDKY